MKRHIKASNNIKTLEQLYPKYKYFDNRETTIRFHGLGFIIGSMILNAIALMIKDESTTKPNN